MKLMAAVRVALFIFGSSQYGYPSCAHLGKKSKG
jgi:hypothetical protein